MEGLGFCNRRPSGEGKAVEYAIAMSAPASTDAASANAPPAPSPAGSRTYGAELMARGIRFRVRV
jgi:hypothetical protein